MGIRSNQHNLAEIPGEDRKETIALYQSGLGRGALRGRILTSGRSYGFDRLRRILRDGDVPLMGSGNQVKHPDTEQGTRVCTSCDEEKPLENFKRAETCIGRRRSQCTECRRKLDRNATLIKKYGISSKQELYRHIISYLNRHNEGQNA